MHGFVQLKSELMVHVCVHLWLLLSHETLKTLRAYVFAGIRLKVLLIPIPNPENIQSQEWPSQQHKILHFTENLVPAK